MIVRAAQRRGQGGEGYGPGQDALAAFARDFGVASPRVAMVAACERLRQRVSEAGWRPGLDAYLRAFGLRVLETPIPTAGRLDYEDGRYVIRVQGAADGAVPRARPPTALRPADATGRQRFSIAHEIGHALLLESLGRQPEHLPGLRDPAVWPELERLCDQAAADLLVPLDDFLRAVGQIGCSPPAIERLLEGFRVSSDVILLRFLAAGARSISLWQVRPRPDGQGGVSASAVRSFRAGRAPGLDPATSSSVLCPDLVLQVASGGRARVPRVEVVPGTSPWRLAAIADGGLLLAVRAGAAAVARRRGGARRPSRLGSDGARGNGRAGHPAAASPRGCHDRYRALGRLCTSVLTVVRGRSAASSACTCVQEFCMALVRV